jgi:nucleoside-diphosphate-sugar epimerase
VEQIVFASTHHTQNATTMFEHKPGSFDPGRAKPKTVDSLPDPDSLYAVTKLFGEMMGRLYSVRYGLRFIALRIGWVTLEERPDRFVGSRTESYLRAFFLSQRDCSAAFDAALRSPERFLIAYAMSRNESCPLDLETSNRHLGYAPAETVDDVLRRSGGRSA